MSIPPLQPSDPLGRGVYSGSRAQIWRSGKKDHQTFLVRPDDDEISVDRLGHVADETMAEIQQQVANLRRASGFYGWAVLSVAEAEKSGRAVRADPIHELELTNDYHAVIQLNLSEGQDRREQQTQHATELTAVAEWKPWPSATDGS